jgi:predicted nucleic acid-binding Zn ribbon protein
MASRRTFIHPGRFAVQRERFQLAWLRPTPPDRTRKLGDLVPPALHELGVDAVDPLVRLTRAWPQVVGPVLAARCRPHALQRGTLTLAVPDSIALMELRPRAPELLAKARLILSESEVRQVRLALDPGD